MDWVSFHERNSTHFLNFLLVLQKQGVRLLGIGLIWPTSLKPGVNFKWALWVSSMAFDSPFSRLGGGVSLTNHGLHKC